MQAEGCSEARRQATASTPSPTANQITVTTETMPTKATSAQAPLLFGDDNSSSNVNGRNNVDEFGEVTPPLETATYILSRRRFAVAALYACGSLVNAFLWICFAPIADITQQRFHVDATAVNMLSLVYLFLYLPGTILSTYLMERYGLRANLIVGAGLNFLSAWVRYGGVQITGSTSASFAVVLIGQSLGALAQPMFTNSPTRVAGTWFAVSERDAVTVVVSMFNPIGNAIGSAVPSLIVSTTDDIPWLLLYQAAVTTVLVALSIAFGTNAPPSPPNAAAAAREQELQAAGGRAATAATALAHMRSEISALLQNRNFLLLTTAFGIGLGLFNALLTVISQLLRPCGYDDTIAGACGGALLVAGLIAAGVAGAIMERTRAYALLFRGGVVAVAIFQVVLLLALRPNALVFVVIAFALLGGTLIPLLPVSLETAVELTWPVSEDTSAGILMLSGQITGIAYIFIVTALLGMNPSADCSSVVTPAAGFILGNMVLALAAAIAFRLQSKRPR